MINDFAREKLTPTLKIINVTPDSSGISFDLEIFDRDKAGYLASLELFCGEQRAHEIDTNKRRFNMLQSDKAYQIRATYAYDLNDNEGIKSFTVYYNTKTLKLATPELQIHNIEPKKNSCTFEIFIKDHDNTGNLTAIELYKKQDKADELYDLSGREFTNLLSNTKYLIVASYLYDLNDGAGEQLAYGYNEVITLPMDTPIVTINNVKVTQDSVTFDIDITDNDSVGELTQIELYNNDVKSCELDDLSERQFTSLYSANMYTIKTTYTYDLCDGQDSRSLYSICDFYTLSLSAPNVSLSVKELSQTHVEFDIDIADEYGIGQITDIELLKDGQKVDGLVDLEYRQFHDLLSNNEYQIRVTYNYDFSDNDGERILYSTLEFVTINKALPIIKIIDVKCSQDSISFNIDITDTDQIGALTLIELYHNDQKVDELGIFNERIFTSLYSNSNYVINVVYAYDLNDGDGEQLLNVKLPLSTHAKTMPVLDVVNVHAYKDSIDFVLNIKDYDGIGRLSSIQLFRGEELADELVDLNDRSFSNLLSGNRYTIRAAYTYDLNDSGGERQLITDYEVCTAFKEKPAVSIVRISPDLDKIEFDLDIVDNDNTGRLEKIELLQGNVKIAELIELSDISFKGLFSGSEYTIVCTYAYDLDDGHGEQLLIASRQVTTSTKDTPTVILDNINATQNSISYKLKITDKAQAGQLISIALYQGSHLVEQATESQKIFKDLMPYTTYSIIIMYAYDLSDGESEKIIRIVKDVTTYPKIGIKRLPHFLNPSLIRGELAFLELGLANPGQVLIHKVKMNGAEYIPLSESTPLRLILAVEIDDKYQTGKEYDFMIDAIYYMINGSEESVDFKNDCSVRKLIES